MQAYNRNLLLRKYVAELVHYHGAIVWQVGTYRKLIAYVTSPFAKSHAYLGRGQRVTKLLGYLEVRLKQK